MEVMDLWLMSAGRPITFLFEMHRALCTSSQRKVPVELLKTCKN